MSLIIESAEQDNDMELEKEENLELETQLRSQITHLEEELLEAREIITKQTEDLMKANELSENLMKQKDFSAEEVERLGQELAQYQDMTAQQSAKKLEAENIITDQKNKFVETEKSLAKKSFQFTI